MPGLAPVAPHRQIPVTVIGGFLGAGKTTVLNGMLRRAGGRRFAVLVNDFGALDIDRDLVERHGGETIALANGCICCSLGEGFVVALARLMNSGLAFDEILVEASGVGLPRPIADLARLDPALHLAAIVVLADAEHLPAQARDRHVGETVVTQLRQADLIVLAKTDLAGVAGAAAASAALHALAPEVPVVTAVAGSIDLHALISVTENDPDGPPDTAGGHAGHGSFRHVEFETSRAVSLDALRAVLARCPASVLRVKGQVLAAEDATRLYVVQCVGRRCCVAQGALRIGPEHTRLQFIGTQEMPGAATLHALLEGAVADGPAAAHGAQRP